MISFQDTLFHFRVLLAEYRHLLKAVTTLANEYKEDKLDLAAFSVSVNAAIDLARYHEGQLRPIVEEYASKSASTLSESLARDSTTDASSMKSLITEKNIYLPFYSALVDKVTSRQGIHPISSFLTFDHDDVFIDYYDQLDVEFAGVYIMLSTFHHTHLLDGPLDGHMLGVPPNLEGSWDVSQDYETLSNGEKWAADKRIVTELVYELIILAKISKYFPGIDEVSRAIRTLQSDATVRMSAVFACQTLLVVHRVLGKDVQRGMGDLFNWIDNHCRSLEDLQNWVGSTDLSAVQWDPYKARHLGFLKTLISEWKSDPFLYIKDKIPEAGVRTREGNFLMSRHPLFCGILLYAGRCYYQGLGVMVKNTFGSILCMVQLYEACKGKGLIDPCWPLMETVLDVQGRQSFCVGELTRNTTAKQIMQWFLLVCGFSVVELSSNRRTSARSSTVTRKRIQEKGAISLKFKERHCEQGERTDFTYNDMRNLLKDTRSAKEIDTENDGGVLLKMIASDLNTEANNIWLDYVAIHMECAKLIRLIGEVGAEESTSQWEPTVLVGYFFTAGFSRLEEVASIIKQNSYT